MMPDALKESPTANRQRVLYCIQNGFTEIVVKQQRKHRFRTSGQTNTHIILCAWEEISLQNIRCSFFLYLCRCVYCIVYMLTCWIEKSRLSFAHSSLFVFIQSFVMIVLFSFPIAVKQSLCVRSFSLRFIFYYFWGFFFSIFYLILLKLDMFAIWICVWVQVVLYLFVVKLCCWLFFCVPLGFRQSSFVRFNHFSIRNWTLNNNHT